MTGGKFELITVKQKLTCHFILIRHLSGQLLHGDVIERTHDDDGPFEISCRHKRLRIIKGVFFVAEILSFGRPPSLSRTLS